MNNGISRKDYFEILIFVGFIFLVLGLIGLIKPYHPLYLFSVGLLLFFGGYYFYLAEKDLEKIELRAESWSPHTQLEESQ